MKKYINIIFYFVCIGLVILLVSCGKTETYTVNQELKNIIDDVSINFRIKSSCNINENILKELFNIKSKEIKDYYGVISLDNKNIDTILYVRTKPKYKDKVYDRLVDYTQRYMVIYKGTEYEKLTQNSIISQFDDYVFLIMTERKGIDINLDTQNINKRFIDAVK